MKHSDQWSPIIILDKSLSSDDLCNEIGGIVNLQENENTKQTEITQSSEITLIWNNNIINIAAEEIIVIEDSPPPLNHRVVGKRKFKISSNIPNKYTKRLFNKDVKSVPIENSDIREYELNWSIQEL